MDVVARPGHFAFESGHHGTLWLDLDGLAANPAQLAPLARSLAARLARHEPEVVCGPFSGGAFLAQLVAAELGTPFVYSMPPAYEVPPSLHEHLRGRRTAVVDDVVNAGSAVTATLAGLRAPACEVVVVGALLTLGRTGRDRVAALGLPLEALEEQAHDLWLPPDCPLCARGVPLSEET